MKKIIVVLGAVLSLVFFSQCHADNIVLSVGASVTSDQPHSSLGEYVNHSGAQSLRYEGEHYGVRLDHSSKGDDDGNIYLTGDALFHPLHYVVAGAGIMVDRKPLRQVGSRMNFHAMLGLEAPYLFGHGGLFGGAGGGLWFDHWSNGHIHELFGPDNVQNPPRNVVSLGIIVPF